MAAASPAPASSRPSASVNGDLDMGAIWQALLRKKAWILIPTLLTLLLTLIAVNLVTPLYKSEARILIDGRDNVFLRPNSERGEDRSALDAEAVTSQVQMLLSRDLAREVPEFDPVLKGVSPLKSILAIIGLVRDPLKMSPEERVLESYYERLTAYAVDKSRVMAVEFQSRSPELAARVASSIADGYLILQQGVRQDQAKAAGQWLSGEIENLRKKVALAEERVEEFRSKSSLFVGTNNTTLSNQQLGEINTQLNTARAQKADAESKSRLIRDMIQRGRPIEASDILNSEMIRRLSEQRATLRGQLAEQSTTLLDNHPRIKELKAQVANLDRQLREEALTISRSLENDAKIAEARVADINANLDQLKKQASSSNTEDVQLRALEREARAERELLESYLAKYREANTRENLEAGPLEGRIISRPAVSNTPAWPKKLPIVLISTLAMLMLTSGFIATSELLRLTAPHEVAVQETVNPARHIGQPRPADAPPPLAPSFHAAPVVSAQPAATILQDDNALKILAATILRSGTGPGKITMLGNNNADAVTRSALSLGRALSESAKTVLIDLSASRLIRDASVAATAPGLIDLVQGKASFGDIISKDNNSDLHLVLAGSGASAGHPSLSSPRLIMTVDALSRVYDFVVLDAGQAADLPVSLLASNAQAVVIPTKTMTASDRHEMREQLLAAGFADATMVEGDVSAQDAKRPASAGAAA